MARISARWLGAAVVVVFTVGPFFGVTGLEVWAGLGVLAADEGAVALGAAAFGFGVAAAFFTGLAGLGALGVSVAMLSPFSRLSIVNRSAHARFH